MKARISGPHALASIAGAALLFTVVGCGDDDGNGGTPDARVTVDAAVTFDGPVTAACPTHPNVTVMGDVCQITGGSTTPITQNLTLTAGKDYLLNGPVFIGNDSTETVLTIQPGVTIFGGTGSFLLIQRASKIMANGTAAAPIVMTSSKPDGQRGSSDWGGLVINGRAPINYGTETAEGEAGTGTYGGTMPDDNSGVLRYVRVEFAGNKVDTENELNGIAFQGVGSGTQVEFVQTHMTSDDGVEFFGGTVNAKHIVITGADDDSLDWTGGWSGKVQFVVAQQLPGSGPDAERGIEADNYEFGHSNTPFSNPTISNVTLIGRTNATARQGIELRRGTKAQLHNFVVTGFGGPCVRVSDTQTAANVTDGSLAVFHMVFNCTGAIPDGATTTLVTGKSVTGDPMLNASWMPAAGSPALNVGAGPGDAFFDAVTYAGAFDSTNNWAAGWTATPAN
jgi:hypothetical protein